MSIPKNETIELMRERLKLFCKDKKQSKENLTEAESAKKYLKGEGPFSLLNIFRINKLLKAGGLSMKEFDYLKLEDQDQNNNSVWATIGFNIPEKIDNLKKERYNKDILTILLEQYSSFKSKDAANNYISFILKDPASYGIQITEEHLNLVPGDDVFQKFVKRNKLLNLTKDKNSRVYQYINNNKDLGIKDYYKINKFLIASGTETNLKIEITKEDRASKKKEAKEWKNIQTILPTEYENRYKNLGELLKIELSHPECTTFAKNLIINAKDYGLELSKEHLEIAIKQKNHELVSAICNQNSQLNDSQTYKNYVNDSIVDHVEGLSGASRAWGGFCGFWGGFFAGLAPGFGILPLFVINSKAGNEPRVNLAFTVAFAILGIVICATALPWLAIPLGFFALVSGIVSGINGAIRGAEIGEGGEAFKMGATITMYNKEGTNEVFENSLKKVVFRKFEQNQQNTPSKVKEKSIESDANTPDIDLVSSNSPALQQQQQRRKTSIEEPESPHTLIIDSADKKTVTENHASDSRRSRHASIEDDDLPADLPIPPSPPAEFLVLGKIKQFDAHSKKHQKGNGNEDVEEEEEAPSITEDEEDDEIPSDEPWHGRF